ncbi:lactate utilization protein C [Xylanimonas allomyrinae]|uniref:Lactate utilization protein C n=1 Tax=Xylanimonas allomyrinae TaxID=2509459 RepID=A0A4P6ELH6_9MICO|nr:LUD domain-containing protein [Xylanimonas allomyrinae]QAY63482.1 lactate utilization protein C [Xylanimonas allomyrinae]
MSARDDVLGRVRAALRTADRLPAPDRSDGAGDDTGDDTGDDAVAGAADVAALFTARVEDYRATVVRVAPADVAAAVRDALGAARRVVVPPGLPPAWLGDVAADVDDDADAAALDRVDAVVTGATLGIAVTGTIVLDHGPGQGRRALSLVPDLHVCVVREADLVPDVPEAVARLAAPVRAGRPLTWISGPSATSDIELERVEGVHGPRTLRVVLIK